MNIYDRVGNIGNIINGNEITFKDDSIIKPRGCLDLMLRGNIMYSVSTNKYYILVYSKETVDTKNDEEILTETCCASMDAMFDIRSGKIYYYWTSLVDNFNIFNTFKVANKYDIEGIHFCSNKKTGYLFLTKRKNIVKEYIPEGTNINQGFPLFGCNYRHVYPESGDIFGLTIHKKEELDKQEVVDEKKDIIKLFSE